MAEYQSTWSQGYQSQPGWADNNHNAAVHQQGAQFDTYGGAQDGGYQQEYYDNEQSSYTQPNDSFSYGVHQPQQQQQQQQQPNGYVQFEQPQPSGYQNGYQDGYDDWDDADEEWDDEAYSGRRSKLPVLAGAAALFFVFVLGGYFFWLQPKLDPSGEPGAAIDVTIPAGSSTQAISTILEQDGVIASSTVFNYYVRLKGVEANFQAGSYELKQNMSVAESIEVLQQGPAARPTIVITEGMWVSEMVVLFDEELDNVSAAELQAVLNSGQIQPKYHPADQPISWEGLLFPASYEFGDDATAEEIVRTMNSEFNRVAAEVGLDDPSKLNGRTAYEIITIASLIESEAAVPEDRAKISEVIHYRLSGEDPLNSWLGIDASVIYGAQIRGLESAKVVELQSDATNLYNTSGGSRSANTKGLPPTPISAPGKASLEAALNPTSEGYSWYARYDPSTRAHKFSTSKEEHDKVDAEFDAKIAALEG